MNRTILIADDKPQMRRVIRGLLESHAGWDVAEAEDGVQAVKQAQRYRPDAVILDLAMPELNGFEAARRIARVLPDVPIFLNTLYASTQVEEEAKKSACNKSYRSVRSSASFPLLKKFSEPARTERKFAPLVRRR